MIVQTLTKHLREDPVFANSFWLMVNTVILTGLGFFFWKVVAAFYSAADVGVATALISAMTLIVMISGLEMGVGLVRFLPTSSDPNRSMNTVIFASTLLCIAVSSVFLLFIGFFSPTLSFVQSDLLYALIFIAGCVATLLFNLLDQLLLTHNLSYVTALKGFIFSIIKIALPPLFIFFSVFGIFGSWTIATTLSVIVSFLFLIRRKVYIPRPAIYEPVLFELLPLSFGNYVTNLVRMLPTLVFPLLITETLGPEQTAYYYISFMIAGLLFIVPNAISASVLAEGSRAGRDVKRIRMRAMLFAGALLIPGTIGLYFIGPFVLLLFGPDYAAAGGPLLRLFALGSILVTINFFYGTQLNIEKRIVALVMRNILIVVVTFGSWFFFFESLGLIGIGYAWMLGLGSIVPFYIYETFIKKEPVHPPSRTPVRRRKRR